MPTFTRVYVEPGVYVEYKPAAELVAAPGGPRVLAIVGSGTLYKPYTETLQRGSGNTDRLTKKVYGDLIGEKPARELTVVKDDTLRTYRYVTDFVVIIDDVESLIEWKSGVATVSTSAISAGINCSVTIRVTREKGGQLVVSDFEGNVSADNANGLKTALENLKDREGNNFSTVVDITAADNIVTITSKDTYNFTMTLLDNSPPESAIPFVNFTVGSSVSTPKRPLVDSYYSVSYYTVKESNDYEPVAVYSAKQAEELFGSYTEESISEGNLTFAAELAFSQRIPVLVCVQVESQDYTGYISAIDKLRNVDVNVVVPLVTDDSIREAVFDYTVSHVESLSTIESRKWRTAVFSLAPSASRDDYLTLAGKYGAPGNPTRNRIVLVYADRPKKNVLLGNTLKEIYLDGIYAAVGVAALSCSTDFDVATSLTRKRVSGFEVSSVKTEDRRRLSDGGVLVLDNYLGATTVVHAVTVSRTGLPSEREYVITNVVDYVQSSCILVLENLFIGRKITEMASIQLLLSVFLDFLRRSEIIADFTNVSVSQNSVEPTQIDVSFRIKPLWPINWIYISFSLTR